MKSTIIIGAIVSALATVAGPFDANVARAAPREKPRPASALKPALEQTKPRPCSVVETDFRAAERAAAYARVRVLARRWRAIDIEIIEPYAGIMPTSIVALGRGCAESQLVTGQIAVVFLDATGQLLDGIHEGVIADGDPRAAWVQAYGRAPDHAAKNAVLVTAIATAPAALATNAAYTLADSPQHLVAITPAQRTELERAMSTVPTLELAKVLARLRIPMSSAALTRAKVPPDAALRAIAGITKYEPISDRTTLAKLIEKADEADDDAAALAAFERCERVAGTSFNIAYSLALSLRARSDAARICRTQHPRPQALSHPMTCIPRTYRDVASVELAHTFQRARVRALSWRTIELDVLQTFSGTAVKRITVDGSNCNEDALAVGSIALFLLDDRGQLITRGETIVLDSDPRAARMIAYAKARTVPQRLAIVVDGILHGAHDEPAHLSRFLFDHPVLLDALTPAQIAQLATHASKTRFDNLILVLIRLRSVPGGLSIYVTSADSVGRKLQALRDFERIRDRKQLAAIAEKETDVVRAMAALERCDRLQPRWRPHHSWSFTLRLPADRIRPRAIANLVADCRS